MTEKEITSFINQAVADQGLAIGIVITILAVAMIFAIAYFLPYLKRKEHREALREDRREEREQVRYQEMREMFAKVASITDSTSKVIEQNSLVISGTEQMHKAMDRKLDDILITVDKLVTVVEPLTEEVVDTLKDLRYKIDTYKGGGQ